MTDVLTRQALQAEIERFLNGSLSSRQLAAWAFDQFCDQEEGNLAFEPGREELIGDVLDELMWADSEPFALDTQTANSWLERFRRATDQVQDDAG